MQTIRGILKRKDGEVTLVANPDDVGRRERVYAACFASKERSPIKPGWYLLLYNPNIDEIRFIQGAWEYLYSIKAQVKVALEASAALEEIEAAGCSYVEQ